MTTPAVLLNPEYVSPGPVANILGTTYTILASDVGTYLRTLSNDPVTITLPPQSAQEFEAWAVFTVEQGGTGPITFAPGSGVTIDSAEGLSTVAQFSVAQFKRTALNTWTMTVIGDNVAGVTEFIELSDVPSTYTGAPLYVVRVKSDETGLEFIDPTNAFPILQDMELLGVNTTADTTNRLAVRAAAALFTAVNAVDGGSGDFQTKINKETAGDTASLLYQTGFSGRAEIGLTGDDNFHFKVSPDGATYYDAIVINRTNGALTFLVPLAVPNGGTGVATLTGIVKGNGTSAFSAAVAGTDYIDPAGLAAYAQPLDADLTALAALATTGLVARTGAGTVAARTLTQPAAGITVTNGGGVAGNPTLALANDLAALEGLASTGIAVRTAADTWAQRTITGTASQITVTNGNGVSGNPTLALDLAALDARYVDVAGDTMTGPLVLPAGSTGADSLRWPHMGMFSAAGGTAPFNYLEIEGSTVQPGYLRITANNRINIQNEDGGASVFTQTNSDSFSPGMYFARRRGTIAAPTGVLNGDLLGSFFWRGYTSAGADTGNIAAMSCAAIEDFTSGAQGNAIVLATTAIGATSRATRLQIDSVSGLQTNGGITIDANRIFRLRVYTVGTLPAAGTRGRLACVSDATAPTYLGALVGGGAVSCPVFDNNAAWVSN